MDDECPNTSSGATTGNACIVDVLDAIDQVAQHYDWARYGVVGTSDEGTVGDTFYPIVPLGTSYADLSAALTSISSHGIDTRNFGEALAGLSNDYFTGTTTDDGIDDDGDGFDADWAEAPIQYYCQETHVIIIAVDRPAEDDNVPGTNVSSSLSLDVLCNDQGITLGTDTECMMDNVVRSMYDADFRSDLSDSQNAIVHILGLGTDSISVAEYLFGNSVDQINNAGIYATASAPARILSGLLLIMQDIRSGTFSRSTPVVAAEGNYLVYTFYELTGDDPLGQGHIRAYEIDDDPTSTTYGQVLYDGPTDYGGAVWDGGDLLVSRPVTAAEQQPDDRDGAGKRDIYTFWEPAVSLSGVSSEASSDRRMGLDYDFVQAVGNDATALDYILDTSDDDYNLDKSTDDAVDVDDLQALVDFARGLPEAEYRYMDLERGNWKLGDSPHSIPVVVEARFNQAMAIEPSYRVFIEEMEANRDAGTSPDIVLVAANDGMLHAFQLEDDSSTSDTEEGEELWAWMPGYVLYREHDAEWAGRLVDLMLYGRTFLFDGSPVIEDVWIDENGDGTRDCDSVPDDCEWHRVVVVQQGKGGPVTLALDITDSNDPEFLWEQTDESDNAAVGYTIGRPSIALIYDYSDSSAPVDTYVAFWGSGRAVPYTSYGSYYENAEPNLYLWAMGDDYWGTTSVGYQDSGDDYAAGDSYHPEADSISSSLQTDSDSEYEYGYIAAALAVVDVDSDGDVDTLYFPMSTSYKPTSEGGSGPGDIEDPGSTWMYKACIDNEDPSEFEWVEFFDPYDDGEIKDSSGTAMRPEVYYAATTSWLSDGSLGVYWGTGSPYSRIDYSEAGYFFAMKDTAPQSCDDDYMEPMTDCGADGIYALEEGEGLTSDPIVYAGVVYFSTWVPEEDRCDGGAGRLYGIDFEDCDPGMDTDGDGTVDSSDLPYEEHEDSYISGVTVTDKGTLFYGSSDVVTDGSDEAVHTIESSTDPFLGTATVAWMEVF